jgi:hypothetical protein
MSAPPPQENELPSLEGHSTSISPSSDNVAEVPPISAVDNNDMQAQLNAFSQGLDWTFFQNPNIENELDWANWQNFEADGFFAHAGVTQHNANYD